MAISGALEAVSLAAQLKIVPTQKHRGVIFTLHHVCAERPDRFQPNAHLSITPQFLDRVLATVRRNGWKPVRLEQLPHLLSRGDNGDRYAVFTLDDGYRNNRSEALPVFRKHEVPFTVFVTSGFMRRSRSIWWMTLEEILRSSRSLTFGGAQMKTQSALEKYAAFDRVCHYLEGTEENQCVDDLDAHAHALGFDPMSIVEREVLSSQDVAAFSRDPLVSIGAHTVNHLNLAKLEPELAAREMSTSADEIGALTGQRPTLFAYPYGRRGAACQREFEIAAQCGFDIAVTTRPGMIGTSDGVNMLSLPRISLNGYFQKSRYIEALLTGLPFRFAGVLGQNVGNG
ncbi:polysaccharide deacetylase family protein [Hoeflea sp. WL0058]|uniref:Chitooligosaccharide deacetylase n=1 Tax=Flavimaribacter sediminis TaxID=2865987 RepID=A0AAE2ZSJ2_9HYPH|nr:polysaccharide deacetylase family protein [Flavimaribacter sediminis]MBW8640152.1 polysaccharide deacetylase family protein [Flavimaribacter sediminis]